MNLQGIGFVKASLQTDARTCTVGRALQQAGFFSKDVLELEEL